MHEKIIKCCWDCPAFSEINQAICSLNVMLEHTQPSTQTHERCPLRKEAITLTHVDNVNKRYETGTVHLLCHMTHDQCHMTYFPGILHPIDDPNRPRTRTRCDLPIGHQGNCVFNGWECDLAPVEPVQNPVIGAAHIDHVDPSIRAFHWPGGNVSIGTERTFTDLTREDFRKLREDMQASGMKALRSMFVQVTPCGEPEAGQTWLRKSKHGDEVYRLMDEQRHGVWRMESVSTGDISFGKVDPNGVWTRVQLAGPM